MQKKPPGSLTFVSQKVGRSESGLRIAATLGDFAGDGRVGAASSMAAVCPYPSVIRGASPLSLYPPNLADWRPSAPTQRLDSRATGVFEGLASLAPRVLRRPSRAEGRRRSQTSALLD